MSKEERRHKRERETKREGKTSENEKGKRRIRTEEARDNLISVPRRLDESLGYSAHHFHQPLLSPSLPSSLGLSLSLASLSTMQVHSGYRISIPGYLWLALLCDFLCGRTDSRIHNHSFFSLDLPNKIFSYSIKRTFFSCLPNAPLPSLPPARQNRVNLLWFPAIIAY